MQTPPPEPRQEPQEDVPRGGFGGGHRGGHRDGGPGSPRPAPIGSGLRAGPEQFGGVGKNPDSHQPIPPRSPGAAGRLQGETGAAGGENVPSGAGAGQCHPAAGEDSGAPGRGVPAAGAAPGPGEQQGAAPAAEPAPAGADPGLPEPALGWEHSPGCVPQPPGSAPRDAPPVSPKEQEFLPNFQSKAPLLQFESIPRVLPLLTTLLLLQGGDRDRERDRDRRGHRDRDRRGQSCSSVQG